MKLLWHSNAPWTGTGYGQQTALFTRRLKDHHDLTISAFWGLEGSILPWNGIPVLPGIGVSHGNSTILEHAGITFGGLRDGVVLTLMDVWTLDAAVWSQLNVASWVPVDHDPAPAAVVGYFADTGAVPIAMSQFGRDRLANAGLEPLYVPHAVDCAVYRPHPKAEAREATSMPTDAFIVGMVAANKGNPSRKSFQEAFQAFKALYDRHRDARLYLHTEITGRFEGVALLPLLDAIGVPREAVIVADQYRAVHFPAEAETMAQIYSALDVLLMPSAAEGFGIPAIEAQACGVPVILSDFSAQTELCGSGWLVEGERVYTPLRSWQFRPSVADIYDALKQAYATSEGGRKVLGEKAREFALQYDINRVMKDHMLPALEAVEQRFAERAPVELAA